MKLIIKPFIKTPHIKFSQLVFLILFCANTIGAQNSCNCPNGGVVISNIGQSNYSLTTLINSGFLPPNQYSGCLVLNGNLDIDTDYTLWNLDANFTGSSSITIKGGNTLSVRSGSYAGCDVLWDGFIAEDQSTIRLSDVAIDDATAGLTLLDGSSFSMKDCYFDNNYRGVFVPPNPGGNAINRIGPITGNTFDASGALLPGAASSFAYTGMELNNTSLLIAGLNFSNSNNTFRNAFNGIVLYETDLQLIGSFFFNMKEDTEGPFVPYSHNGIYSQNSNVLSARNTYNNLGFGIKANSSSVLNTEDTYNNMEVGVEIVEGLDGYASLNNSEYSNYTAHGIAMFNGQGAIGSNSFTNTYQIDPTINGAVTGITIWTSILDSIGSNFFNLSPDQRGIDINSSHNISISNNDIIFSDYFFESFGWATGIRLSRSRSNNIIKNYVSANSRIPSTAFNIQNSRSNNIECNTAQEPRIGFSFNGNCSSTDFKGNVMRNNIDAGLVINKNSRMGQQDHNGNQWCNGSTAVIINSVESASQFLVDPSMGIPPQCTTDPVNNGTFWFIQQSTQVGRTFECEDGDGGETMARIEDPVIIAAEKYEAETASENIQGIVTSVKIYPNPSTGNVQINFDKTIENGQIIIRDLFGRIVFSTQIQGKLTSQSIDLSHLKGIYFLCIKGEGVEDLIEKIIIQ